MPTRLRYIAAVALIACLPPAGADARREHRLTTIEASQVFAQPADAALADAAADGRIADVQRLIAEGADPNAVGREGVSPLMWALVHRNADGMAALLASGADAAHADTFGETALHMAARTDDPRFLETLLDAGADPDVRAVKRAYTPLFDAIEAQRQAQFELLIAMKANLDAQDAMGNTPLHLAARIQDYRRVLELLQAGADPASRNRTAATFQRYLMIGPKPALVSPETRALKAQIADWLESHGHPLEAGLR